MGLKNFSNKADAEQICGRILKILDCIPYLTQAYNIDFFIEGHWEKLPSRWREYFSSRLDSYYSEEFPKFINCGQMQIVNSVRDPAPLSFLALRKSCQVYSFDRRIAPLNSTDSADEKLKRRLKVGIKPKKQHEIAQLRPVVLFLAKETNVNHVTDVGSGLGHLARHLAASEGILVTTIEADAKFVEKSAILDRKLRLKSDISVDREVRVLPFEDTADRVLAPGQKSILIGLHTCGDLAPAILKEFVRNDEMSALLSLGCCYHKLNGGCIAEKFDCNGKLICEEVFGYPLSKYVKDLNCFLPFTARESACHAVESHAREMDFAVSNAHCFRAVLEWIIDLTYPGKYLRRFRDKKRAWDPKLNFYDYCTAVATKRSDLAEILTQIERPEVRTSIDSFLSRSKEMNIFYGLKQMIGCLVETLILLDRLLFLCENKCAVKILPVFDPVVSPRNLAIIAQHNVLNQ